MFLLFYKIITHLNSATITHIRGCMLVHIVDVHCHCRTMSPVRKHPGFFFLNIFSCGPTVFWVVRTQAQPPHRLLFLVTCDLVSICLGYRARNGGPGPSTWLHDNNIIYKVVVLVDVPPTRAKVLPRIHPHQQVVLSDFLTFANLVGANGISLLF